MERTEGKEEKPLGPEQLELSEPLARGEGEPGILSAICWPACTLKASAAPVQGSQPLGEGPQNTALLYTLGQEEGGGEQDCTCFSGPDLAGGATEKSMNESWIGRSCFGCSCP